MIEIRDKETGKALGSISEADLQALIDHLEEQDSADQDYYIDADTIDMLGGEGAPPALLDFLRRSLGDRDGIEIEWSRP